MNDMINQKYQYERLIKTLNDNYNNLNICYNNLIETKKKIINNFTINDNYYSKDNLDNIIKNIEEAKNKILNVLLPQARKQYNNILLEISKM